MILTPYSPYKKYNFFTLLNLGNNVTEFIREKKSYKKLYQHFYYNNLNFNKKKLTFFRYWLIFPKILAHFGSFWLISLFNFSVGSFWLIPP